MYRNTFLILAHVKRAAQHKKSADRVYRGALRAAHDAGHSYAEIAKAAGTSRQAVRQMILRGGYESNFYFEK